MSDKSDNHRSITIIRALRSAIVFALIVFLLATGAVSLALFAAPRISSFQGIEATTLYAAVKSVGYASLGEEPHIAPIEVTGAVPICPEVAESSIKPLKRAFALMRGTDEGSRLFDVLVDNEICVLVDDIPYNAAYAESRRTFPDDWSSSRIVVDRSLVRTTSVDLLAAILVHEATHIDRAVSGTACFFQDTCERLKNGVEIDEEIAAHTAEAEWWIAAFGVDGKRFAFQGDYGENKLAEAYLKGEEAFRLYVFDYRNDPREGIGI